MKIHGSASTTIITIIAMARFLGFLIHSATSPKGLLEFIKKLLVGV
jgi:hypothetical protein